MQRLTTVSRNFVRSRAQVSQPKTLRAYANMSAPKAAETDTEAARVQSTTGVTAESLKKKLEEGIGARHVDIQDMSGRSGFVRESSDVY